MLPLRCWAPRTSKTLFLHWLERCGGHGGAPAKLCFIDTGFQGTRGRYGGSLAGLPWWAPWVE